MATIQITATEIYEELKAASLQGFENAKDSVSMFPCGSAVVMLKSGRTKFAQDLKKLGLADVWYGKSGLALKTYSWMGFAGGGQCYDMNVAVCEEMVRLLEGYGIEAYVHSWID
jgi:hypothetical protein